MSWTDRTDEPVGTTTMQTIKRWFRRSFSCYMTQSQTINNRTRVDTSGSRTHYTLAHKSIYVDKLCLNCVHHCEATAQRSHYHILKYNIFVAQFTINCDLLVHVFVHQNRIAFVTSKLTLTNY
jgi:hypothetical protein